MVLEQVGNEVVHISFKVNVIDKNGFLAARVFICMEVEE